MVIFLGSCLHKLTGICLGQTAFFCTAYLELHVVPEQANLGRTSKSHVEHMAVTLLCEGINDEAELTP